VAIHGEELTGDTVQLRSSGQHRTQSACHHKLMRVDGCRQISGAAKAPLALWRLQNRQRLTGK
jgi:hypothetical protein